MWRYIHTRGQTFGPADLDRLQIWFQEGRFGPDDWVWIDEENRWVAARECPDLAAFFRSKGSGFYSSKLAAAPSSAAPAASSGGTVSSGSVPAPVVRQMPIPESLFEHERKGNRHYLRFDAIAKGRYYAVQAQRMPTERDYHHCRVLNVSMGGIGIETEETIEPGRTIRIETDFGDESFGLFKVMAIVVRTAPSLEFGYVEHGVMFSNLPADDRRNLIRFLERRLSGGA